MSIEDRIVELEIRFTQQEHIIEELSKLVEEQWKTITHLQASTKFLMQHYKKDCEQGNAPPASERPPHW